ncbi:putative RNA-directed DNA polymerase from transposon BS [Trichonephila clavipes]|nr:putative RNA-directed DNA polymerase from transposon BS [Trichonephila clavipes]
MTGTLPPLLDSMVGGGTPGRSYLRVLMDPNMLCPSKGLVLPTFTIDQVAAHSRFLLISLPNKEMSIKSPFAIHKALLGIGGEPKSIKRLRPGDLLIETISDLQTKSFLLAKTFLNSPVTVSPHKTLNSSRGVISEPDLLSTPESEILEGFSDQGVIQVRRITIKKDSNIIPTKHLILTFNSPKLPTNVKAGYLNCKIRAYIPNHLRCFKCQRFGHSQIACRGQLTCSRCVSVGHSSADCSLEPKCVNCSQPHSSDYKQCSKWKAEKEIQAIKTNRNVSYLEARKLIAPQLSQTYAQFAKSSTATSTTQTDENITQIKCPPLQLLQPLLSVPQSNKYPSITSVSTSSSTTQANLLPSASSIKSTTEIESRLPEPISFAAAPDNSLNTSASSLSTETRPLTTSNKSAARRLSTEIQPLPESVPPASNDEHFNAPEVPQCAKRNSRSRRKRPKVQKAEIEIKMAPHRPRKSAPTELTTDDEDMIMYDVQAKKLEPNPEDKFAVMK